MSKTDTRRKPRKRDRDATRKRLLEAAVRVFARHGYDGATTKAVADEADVAEALIQRYFVGKQGLLLALLQGFAADQKESGLDLPPKAEDFEAEVGNLLRDALTHAAQRKEYLSVVLSRAVIDRGISRGMAKFLECARAPVLAARLKQHQDSGSLSQRADLEALSYGLALTMLAVAFLGQIVLRLDPKLLDRIVVSLAQALSGTTAAGAQREADLP